MNTFFQIFNDVWTLNILLAACIAFPSGIIQGYAGFGGALVSVPFFAILFGPVTGFGMVLIIVFCSQGVVFSKAIGQSNWKEVVPLAGTSAITMSLGILFLVSADPSFIKRGMGFFILLITIFMIFGWQYSGKKRPLIGMGMGAITGGITGSFGVPAFPLSALYFHTSNATAKTKRANVTVTLGCNVMVAICGLIMHEIYDQSLIFKSILISPFFILGTLLGQFLFKIAPVEWFKFVTYGILIIIALALLFT